MPASAVLDKGTARRAGTLSHPPGELSPVSPLGLDALNAQRRECGSENGGVGDRGCDRSEDRFGEGSDAVRKTPIGSTTAQTEGGAPREGAAGGDAGRWAGAKVI